MAKINDIRILHSSTTAVPSSLGFGELAYSDVTGVKALYVGDASGDPVKVGSLASTSISVATASALGTVKLGSDVEQSTAANSVTSTASRTYAVQLNADDQMVVNVPWVDTNTDTDTHHQAKNVVTSTSNGTTDGSATDGNVWLNLVENGAVRSNHNFKGADGIAVTSNSSGDITWSGVKASTTSLGVVKTGYTTSGQNYGVAVDATGAMYVNVPWTDTNTDTNTTYDHLAVTTSGGALLRLHSSAGTNDDVKFASGTNTTVSYTDANTITINSVNTTYSTATSSALGLVKVGYAENGKNYPVELSDGKMFVNVPWTDTTTEEDTLHSVTTRGNTTTNDIQVNGLTVDSNASVGGNLTVTGNLNVDGEVNAVNSSNLDVTDKNITMSNGSISGATSDGAGIIIDLGTDGAASLLYDDTNAHLEFNMDVSFEGNDIKNSVIDCGTF